MKKILVGLGVVALILGGAVSASAISYADVTDVTGVFSTGWTQFADNDGVISAGGGGQAFDAEYLFYKLDGTTLSVGLQTGFDVLNGEQLYSGQDYYAGDLALSFDGDNGAYEYAFDFGFATRDYYGDAVGGQVEAGLYKVSAWNDDPGAIYYNASNPFAMESGVLAAAGTTSSGKDTSLNTYWRTMSFDLASLGLTSFDGLDAHWTMSCGNDAINGTAPVPEPATMLLFGSGLAGLIGARRRKKK